MQAVILAAGEGARMRPLTLDTPKPLLRVAGKPLLDRIFECLPSEVDEAVIVVRYLAEKIRAHCEEEFYGRKIRYAEGSDRGAAYSFLAARPYIKNGRFIFTYGDEIFTSDDVSNCLSHDLSILCLELPDPWNHGVARLRVDGSIAEIEEKPGHPSSNLIAGGLMVLDEKIFNYKPEPNAKGEYYFTSMLNQYVKNEKVMPVKAERNIGGISTPADIERVEKSLQ